MKELLKDKTIRIHLFGTFQFIIGLICIGYLAHQCDNVFETCLFGFATISFVFGMMNIKKAEKRMAAVATEAYIIAKAMKHEEIINNCLENDEIQYLASIEEEGKEIVKENK